MQGSPRAARRVRLSVLAASHFRKMGRENNAVNVIGIASAGRCRRHRHRVRRRTCRRGIPRETRQDRRAVRRRRLARRHRPGDRRPAQEGAEGALRGPEHPRRRRRQGHRRSQQGQGRRLYAIDGLYRRVDRPAADFQAGLCDERLRSAGPARRGADRPRRQGGQPVQVGEGHRRRRQGQTRRHQIRHARPWGDPAHQHGDLRQEPRASR